MARVSWDKAQTHISDAGHESFVVQRTWLVSAALRQNCTCRSMACLGQRYCSLTLAQFFQCLSTQPSALNNMYYIIYVTIERIAVVLSEERLWTLTLNLVTLGIGRCPDIGLQAGSAALPAFFKGLEQGRELFATAGSSHLGRQRLVRSMEFAQGWSVRR